MAREALTIRQRALAYLARREYSRQELRRKLAPHAEDADELDSLLDDFAKRGWLSEQRFVEQVVRVRGGRFGSRYIAHELRQKGVDETLIEQALPQLQDDELATARAVWQKKFGHLPEDQKERARQMRFLLSRGFSQAVIMKVLRQQEQD